MDEFNGYEFDDKKHRKRMRYVAVIRGDLDLNGAYAFKSKKELNEYLKEEYWADRVQAIFKVEDITP